MTITIDELKQYLGRGQADQFDDTLLQWAVDSANAAVKAYTGRTFLTPADPLPDPTTRTYRSGSLYELLIDDVHDIESVSESCDNVTYTDVPTGWWLEPFDVTPQYRLTGRCWMPFVRVMGQHDYGSIPQPARQAGLLIANRIYQRKDSADGIAFGDTFAIRPSRFEDGEVVRLLDPLRRVDKVMGIG